MNDLMTDEETSKCKQIADRYYLASTGYDWLLENEKEKIGDNWMVCSLGNSGVDGKDYYITTNMVRASQYDGDSKADGEFIVNARRDIFYLGELLDRMNERFKNESKIKQKTFLKELRKVGK